MKNTFIILFTLLLTANLSAGNYSKDIFKTSKGNLEITFIGHGTLMMEFEGKVIHIDPVSQFADYNEMPKADLILITHEHGDHLDATAIDAVKKATSEIVQTKNCAQKYTGTAVLRNGESGIFAGLKVEAVPAYNIKHERAPGQPFHPKGVGNGYIIHFGDKTVYVAGDTENIPEMKNLKGIDIAFLPMNLPYTMTPAMVADAAKSFNPKILYPYHFGNTNTNKLVELLKDKKDIEVRIRKLN